MTDDERTAQNSGDAGGYAPGGNPSDPNEHRHGGVVHSHQHRGAHEHGDDYEYDEAHDPERPGNPGDPAA